MTSKTLQHATEAADGIYVQYVSYDTRSSNSAGALLVGTSIKTEKPPCTCDGNPLAFSSTHRNKICSVALLRAWVAASGIGSGWTTDSGPEEEAFPSDLHCMYLMSTIHDRLMHTYLGIEPYHTYLSFRCFLIHSAEHSNRAARGC